MTEDELKKAVERLEHDAAIEHPPPRPNLQSQEGASNSPGRFAQPGNNGGSEPKGAPWLEPAPLEDHLLPVLSLGVEMIPQALEGWLSDIALRMQCPLDFLAPAAIAMFGSLVGAMCRIRPKANDNWEEVPNFYGGVVAPPGAMKTPAMSAVFSVIGHLEAEAWKAYAEAKKEYEIDLAKYKRKRADLEAKLGGDDDAEDELRELTEPEEPVWRRFRTSNATIEKHHEILAKDPRAGFSVPEELMGLLSQWDVTGHERDRSFFLQGYNGKDPYPIDRAGRGTVWVKNLCLSVFGGIQPALLAKYLEGLRVDGMISRFQLLVYPDPIISWEYVDLKPDSGARDRILVIAERLAYTDFRDCGADEDEEGNRFFRFDGEAQELFKAWITELETGKLSNKDGDPAVLQHLAKQRGLMPKLALTFHLIEVMHSGASSGRIPVRHAEMAVRWCKYLESHARRIYGLAKNPSMQSAIALGRKLSECKLKDGFTVRDLCRKCWAGLATRELVVAALARLEEAHWVRGIEKPAGSQGGRPTVYYLINPAVAAAGRQG